MTGEELDNAGHWPPIGLYSAAWAPLALAYFLVFLITTELSFGWLAATVLVNIAAPYALGLAIYRVLMNRVFSARPAEQIVSHVLMAVPFTLIWLVVLRMLLSLLGWLRSGEWLNPAEIFLNAALVWQVFQGLMIYFLIVAGSYAIWASRRLEAAAAMDMPAAGRSARSGSAPQRLFVRGGDEIIPVDTTDIVCINGADDYSEIVTKDGARLARLTLNELERRLDPEQFKRIHRSHIVNVGKIASIETRRGGGLRLIMIEGSVVPASRSGADALRPYLA